MRTQDKFALLGALYLAQGLPFGFFTQAVPALLRAEGTALPLVGLSSALALPWALKFLWAPAVDRYYSPRMGRRRSWILPLQAITVALLVGLAFTEGNGALHALALGMFLTSLVAATQDIATDGLAVDLLAPSERGLGNGVQVAGYRVGMIVGGGALLVVFDRLGWSVTFLCMAAVVALSTVPVFRLDEPRSQSAPPTGLWSVTQRALTRPGLKTWLAVLVAFKFGESLGGGMLRPLLTDVGVTLSELAVVVGGIGSIAGLLGALVGGWLAGHDRRFALLACGGFQAVAVALYAIVTPEAGLPLVTAIVAIEHFAGGTATAALFTAMMDTARSEQGATEFTLQASVVVLSSGLAASFSGFSAEALGYSTHFILAGALATTGAAVAWAQLPRLSTSMQVPPWQ